VFSLTGRGEINAGNYADLVIFDPDTIIDRADFADPTAAAAGIEAVFVNGRRVVDDGGPTGERPGKAVRRQAMRAEIEDH
jgi:N-acyl-D-amino-acid deacylase